MAIENYGELKTAIQEWLDRTDAATVAKIPQFISNFETRAGDIVYSRHGILRTTITLTGQFTALPTDFSEFDLAWIASPYRKIRQEDTKQLADLRERNANAAGPLELIAVVGGEIEAYPTPTENTVLSCAYFRKVPALVDDEDTNWLLDAHPDIYLYGSLIDSAPYLHDDARINLWSGMLDRRLAEINVKATRSKFGASGPGRIRHRAIG